jgi:hypothetical protein
VTDKLTLAHVESAASALRWDSRSRWYLRLTAEVTGLSHGLYVACSIWRVVDQDYDNVEGPLKVGNLAFEDGVPTVLLDDGVDLKLLLWVIKLCRDRGVSVKPPFSVRQMAEALA